MSWVSKENHSNSVVRMMHTQTSNRSPSRFQRGGWTTEIQYLLNRELEFKLNVISYCWHLHIITRSLKDI